MKLPPELEDQYVKEVLYNRSLEDLPDEEWRLIEGFENYAISNYGRVKSLERMSLSLFGKERWLPELIRKLTFVKQFNNYLQADGFNVHCGFIWDGRKYTRSVARLVYYHFVEEFDLNNRLIVISCKDGNSLHIHCNNLEKISASEKRLKTFRQNRARNLHVDYLQPISQYTAEGVLIADFKSIYVAGKKLGIAPESILDVVNKRFLTAGTFRWFLQSNPPKKEDFIIATPSDISADSFNQFLWEKLGKPLIDKDNPPPCMNLSLEDLPGEYWIPIPIPNFENRFMISNKGRVKRLEGWTSKGRKIFLKEQILSQFMIRNSDTTYSLYCRLNNEGKEVLPVMSKLLYYCFVEKFDLKNKRLAVVNESNPQWNIDLSKLSLRPVSYVLRERNRDFGVIKVRTIFNSKKVFNDSLWKKLGKPQIYKKNPPAVFNLSIKDLPDEQWRPLPGFEGKYVISNKGRIKRLSGWSAGYQFFGEEQIISLNVIKKNKSGYLYFKLHPKEDTNPKMLLRLLYYCFVEQFDLNDKTLRVINENEPLWDIDLSKLSLRSIADAFNKTIIKK